MAKKTLSDKILKDWAYEMALNPKYNRYQRGLASMVYRFFGKKKIAPGTESKVKCKWSASSRITQTSD